VAGDFDQYASQLELRQPLSYDELLIYRSLLTCKRKMMKALTGEKEDGNGDR